MEWNDISLSGRWKLIRWLKKQNRAHRRVCTSKIIANAPDEKRLFKVTALMTKYFNEQEALRATTEAQGIQTT